jgi:predicted PurR-regulated permease PerM
MTQEGKNQQPKFSPGLSSAFLLFLIIVITYFFFKVIRPFVVAIFLGAIITSLCFPLYRWLRGLVKGRESLASLLSCLIIFLVIIIPVAGILTIVAAQAVDFYNQLDAQAQSDSLDVEALVARIDVAGFMEKFGIEKSQLMGKLAELGKDVSTFLLKSIQKVTQGAFNVIATLFLTFFSMYYFFKDGPAFLANIKTLLPLSDEYEDRILDRFTSMTRATMKGTLVVALIQGALGGITFWLFDVPSYLFWGLIMVILAMIPLVGTALVWVPAGIVKILLGQWMQGIGILVVGVALISSIDNLLKPRLVGKDTEMHPLLIFFGTLGGIGAFGIIGFLIGPIVAALFVTIWDIYAREFRT